MSWSTVTV
nr:unnamed protein product [Callosobruchus chinensis]